MERSKHIPLLAYFRLTLALDLLGVKKEVMCLVARLPGSRGQKGSVCNASDLFRSNM